MQNKNFKSGFKRGFLVVIIFFVIGTNWDATFCTPPPQGSKSLVGDWWCQTNSKRESNKEMNQRNNKEHDFFGPWQTRKRLGHGTDKSQNRMDLNTGYKAQSKSKRG